jgi:hypothetical protein
VVNYKLLTNLSISPIKVPSPISGKLYSRQTENFIPPSLIKIANLAYSPLVQIILLVSN